ncbi:Uncharacterised protein [Vibrio cholerae]|nr:Uncharacterised protein [Vibrio cholerae]
MTVTCAPSSLSTLATFTPLPAACSELWPTKLTEPTLSWFTLPVKSSAGFKVMVTTFFVM